MTALTKPKPTLVVARPMASQQDVTFSARQLAEEALDFVAATMRGEHRASTQLRFKAAVEILDRAVGKAPIKVDVTESLSPEEIRELAGQIVQQNQLLEPPPEKPG